MKGSTALDTLKLKKPVWVALFVLMTGFAAAGSDETESIRDDVTQKLSVPGGFSHVSFRMKSLEKVQDNLPVEINRRSRYQYVWTVGTDSERMRSWCLAWMPAVNKRHFIRFVPDDLLLREDRNIRKDLRLASWDIQMKKEYALHNMECLKLKTGEMIRDGFSITIRRNAHCTEVCLEKKLSLITIFAGYMSSENETDFSFFDWNGDAVKLGLKFNVDFGQESLR